MKIPTVDAEVRWTVDSTTSKAVCPAFGIERWDVEVSGPEQRAVSVPCAAQWTTGNELMLLTEGSYAVTLRAFDGAGVELVRITSNEDLFNVGFVEVVDFDVSSADL